MGKSLEDQFAELPPAVFRQWLAAQDDQTIREIARREWWWTARPEQIPPPGDWSICLLLAGRGFGKSKLASEWLIDRVQKHPVDRHGFRTEWLAIAETLSDARTILIEGPSGMLRSLERQEIPHKYIRWPKPIIEIGEAHSRIFFEGADDADVGRGYNAAGAVLDEVGKWKRARDSWYEGILPSLRADLIDDHPRTLVATTPKPIDIIREWASQRDGSVHVVRGSTFDNATNLNSHMLAEMERRYAGTVVGRQELYGELLDARDGSLWNFADIELTRVLDIDGLDFAHITVGVDPTQTDEGDEMGVVVAARTYDNHMYVLDDESVPGAGRIAAIHIWHVMHKWGADSVVYEENAGKKWIRDVLVDAYNEIRDKDRLFPAGTTPPLKSVDSRLGKKLRAEPVAMRYEQQRVHHYGTFKELEKEMLDFDPADSHNSPNRMDALVHACRHLMKGERRVMRVSSPSNMWMQTR